MVLTYARRRGLHPEQAEPLYLNDTEEITIRLPTPLWHWLKDAVGMTSQAYCVEETIVTALRSLAGPQLDTGMAGAAFIAMAADCRGISHAEALFGPMNPDEERQVTMLLEAARAASRGPESFTSLLDHGDDPAETAAIVNAWSAVAGVDMAVVIERERERQNEEDLRMAREVIDSTPNQAASGSAQASSAILDDDLPF